MFIFDPIYTALVGSDVCSYSSFPLQSTTRRPFRRSLSVGCEGSLPGDYMNIECHASVSGAGVREDMAKLQEGPQIVVGTPGRVFDMINRRALRTDNIKIFCLEEADEMLTHGFKGRIYEVFRLLPQATQVVLLSAIMPADVLEATKKFVREPVRILIKRVEFRTLGDIKQFYIAVEKEEWKLDTLCDLYEMVTSGRLLSSATLAGRWIG